MFIIYLLIIKRSPSSLLGGFIYSVCKKKKEKKKGGRGRKKIIPKYNKRRTVSADFHLHKFSYILVKIIAGAEECSGSVEAEERKCSAAAGGAGAASHRRENRSTARRSLLSGHEVSQQRCFLPRVSESVASNTGRLKKTRFRRFISD